MKKQQFLVLALAFMLLGAALLVALAAAAVWYLGRRNRP